MKSFEEYFGNGLEFQRKSDIVDKINALIAASDLNGGEIDTLYKAYEHFPMDSGDTPSKSGRGSLINKGILCIIAHESNHYNFALTYPFGLMVLEASKLLSELNLNK